MAVNEVVNALKPSQGGRLEGQLRVVNGISTTTSSTLTTAARENVPVSPPEILPGRLGNSTIRWGGNLQSHPELREHEDDSSADIKELPEVPIAKKPITPSLATLEKAVSARIYFENLYFPLLRHPPSREQRRYAMEKDMAEMRLSEIQKEGLRARWRQNETEYLRERRSKVDVNAFVKLKTIGHGKCAD
jgi:protein-serine/threonine kinase